MSNGFRHESLRIVTWLVVACCLTSLPAHAEPAHPDSTITKPSLAVVLFISGETPLALPMNVLELREAGESFLNGALIREGYRVLPQARLDEHLVTWRIRNEWSASRGFLDEIADRYEIDNLLVANLIARRGELVLAARFVDVVTGRLEHVFLGEAPMGIVERNQSRVIGPDWRLALDGLSKDLALTEFNPEPVAAQPVVVLPAKAVGCRNDLAAEATYCLLAAILKNGEKALTDPSLPLTLLQVNGINPILMTRDALHILESEFGNVPILMPQLISFDAQGTARSSEIPGRGKSDTFSGSLDAFNLTVAVLETGTGNIAVFGNRFDEHDRQPGWFGVLNDDTLLERLQSAAHSLWADLVKKMEET